MEREWSFRVFQPSLWLTQTQWIGVACRRRLIRPINLVSVKTQRPDVTNVMVLVPPLILHQISDFSCVAKLKEHKKNHTLPHRSTFSDSSAISIDFVLIRRYMIARVDASKSSQILPTSIASISILSPSAFLVLFLRVHTLIHTLRSLPASPIYLSNRTSCKYRSINLGMKTEWCPSGRSTGNILYHYFWKPWSGGMSLDIITWWWGQCMHGPHYQVIELLMGACHCSKELTPRLRSKLIGSRHFARWLIALGKIGNETFEEWNDMLQSGWLGDSIVILAATDSRDWS